MIANRPSCHSALDVNVHRLEGDATGFAFGVLHRRIMTGGQRILLLQKSKRRSG
jgi:hypothetical protein